MKKNITKNTLSDFSWVTISPKKYMDMVQNALKVKQNIMTAVKAIPDKERTFENTVHAMEYIDEHVNTVWGEIEFLMNVKPKKSDREAAKSAVDYMEAHAIELSYDEDIYNAYTALAAKKPKLTGADKKLFEDSLRGYRRMGFGLPAAKRNQIKRQVQQLANITSNFRKNINDYDDYIEVTREELDGASENYISGLKKKGDKYIVTLDYPDYVPFMENVHNEKKRAELLRKYLQKGGKKNIIVLSKMVKLRDEVAKLLGYKDHAEYKLEIKMVRNPDIVVKFISSLVRPLRKKVETELKHLRSLKSKYQKVFGTGLNQHDIPYLINKDKKERYGVDDELVREYFPLETVTKGLFGIYEKLLGVKFKQAAGIPTWHADVQCYEVHDVKSKKYIAYFFMDLYPREGKYGHAAVFPIIPGMQLDSGEYQKPVVSMVCNFPKPTKKQPSLLSHDQVETYFHEFGHVVHGVLTKARYGTHSGTSVQRDFVEAPSQMLENWVWDKSVLSLLSGHFKNPRKKLPKELLEKMIAAKYHMIAYVTMRQLIFGMFDMRLHTESVKDIPGLYASLVSDYANIILPKDQLFPAGFGHLDGYDAGYYGYMWSQVYAADMFTKFKKAGLLNPKIGAEYRTKILEPGGSKDAMQLLKDFLGRVPNHEAFLKEIGL